MARRLRIVTVCAAGVGSSLMLKFNVRTVLEQHGIATEITNVDMTTAKGAEGDIVLVTPDILHAVSGGRFRWVVVLQNIVSKKELEEKLLPICRELLQEEDEPKG